MNADETDAQGTLLSLRDAATALGLRPATVKQYILRGQLAAVRVPCGHATRLFVAPAELERYRRASLGGQGWDKRRGPALRVPTDASRSRCGKADVDTVSCVIAGPCGDLSRSLPSSDASRSPEPPQMGGSRSNEGPFGHFGFTENGAEPGSVKSQAERFLGTRKRRALVGRERRC